LTAAIRDNADHGADDGRHDHCEEADEKRDLPGLEQARRDVAPQRIGAEDMRPGSRRRKPGAQVDVKLVKRQEVRAKHAGQRQAKDHHDTDHRQPVARETVHGARTPPACRRG
jgi:hypothetical protein